LHATMLTGMWSGIKTDKRPKMASCLVWLTLSLEVAAGSVPEI